MDRRSSATDGLCSDLCREAETGPHPPESVMLRSGRNLDFAREGTVYMPVDAVVALSLRDETSKFQIGFASAGDIVGIHRLLAPRFPAIGAAVLCGGEAVRLDGAAMLAMMDEHPGLRARLLDYAFGSAAAFLAEAASAVALTLEKRVARWISAYGSLLASDEIRVTHQDVASALGVRRSGVTVALHILEGQHIIRSQRACIKVLDPAALGAYADEGQPEPAH